MTIGARAATLISCSAQGRSGGIGRRAGFKIPLGSSPVWVRVPPPAPCNSKGRKALCRAPFFSCHWPRKPKSPIRGGNEAWTGGMAACGHEAPCKPGHNATRCPVWRELGLSRPSPYNPAPPRRPCANGGRMMTAGDYAGIKRVRHSVRQNARKHVLAWANYHASGGDRVA